MTAREVQRRGGRTGGGGGGGERRGAGRKQYKLHLPLTPFKWKTGPGAIHVYIYIYTQVWVQRQKAVRILRTVPSLYVHVESTEKRRKGRGGRGSPYSVCLPVNFLLSDSVLTLTNSMLYVSGVNTIIVSAARLVHTIQERMCIHHVSRQTLEKLQA